MPSRSIDLNLGGCGRRVERAPAKAVAQTCALRRRLPPARPVDEDERPCAWRYCRSRWR